MFELTAFKDTIRTMAIGFFIYLFIMLTLSFLILYHVVDIHTIVENLRECTTAL